jgi:hypothetical protein
MVPMTFVLFVTAVKEGMPAEEALRQFYKQDIDGLVRAYGSVVGVPGLHR